MFTFTSYQNAFTDRSQNTSTANATRGMQLINESLKYVTQKYYFNEKQFTTTTVAGQQTYTLPFDVKDIINATVTVGGILWQPLEAGSRQFWDSLNTVSFSSDFPQFYFRFKSNQINLFPIPTSNGNTLTINYKSRIRDLSAADYSTGTVTVTSGSATVTGVGTSWTSNMANRWLNVPLTASNATSGDDGWYQIQTVASATSLTLWDKYTGDTATSASGGYTIGETPLLPEDYQDLALYRALWVYYSTININEAAAAQFENLYNTGKAVLDYEFGSKSESPVLTPPDAVVFNPNAFPRVS
jgi:hypothetical protein